MRFGRFLALVILLPTSLARGAPSGDYGANFSINYAAAIASHLDGPSSRSTAPGLMLSDYPSRIIIKSDHLLQNTEGTVFFVQMPESKCIYQLRSFRHPDFAMQIDFRQWNGKYSFGRDNVAPVLALASDGGPLICIRDDITAPVTVAEAKSPAIKFPRQACYTQMEISGPGPRDYGGSTSKVLAWLGQIRSDCAGEDPAKWFYVIDQ